MQTNEDLTKNLVKHLINDVEQVILDLTDVYIAPNKEINGRKGVPIQPLRGWTDQSAVLDFKELLRKRFKKTLDKS